MVRRWESVESLDDAAEDLCVSVDCCGHPQSGRPLNYRLSYEYSHSVLISGDGAVGGAEGGLALCGGLNVLRKQLQGGLELWIVLTSSLDRTVGVEDGSVVPAAEVSADLLEAVAGEIPGQVHANLPWEGN